MRLQSNNLKSNKASILIIALWSVSFLTTMAVILGFQVRQKLILIKRLEDRDIVRLIADAGIKKAIASVVSVPQDKYSSLNQKWSNDSDAFKDVNVGEGRFSVSYENDSGTTCFGLIDEESKININKVNAQLIGRLFRLAGLEESEAQDLAMSVIDWRDADSQMSSPTGGAEDPYYRNLPAPYEAKDAPFESIDELLLVKGVNENIFQKVKKYITIYGNGRVNVNTATKIVLMAVGYSENIADKIIAYRNGKDSIAATNDDNFFESISEIGPKISDTANLNQAEQAQIANIETDGVLTTSSANFMAVCHALSGRSKFVSDVVCVINRKGNILYWNEY
jgi:general secretion pathway protein K